jgi:hypothetical protein
MNKDNAHEYLPLVQALADGKKIQCNDRGEWVDVECLYTDVYGPHEYRIKPEPRTFEIVRSKLSGDIYIAKTYDGSAPATWEYITVQEVLQ